MKKIFTLLLLGGLLFVGAGNVWGTARSYSGTENLYFNADGSDIDWKGSSAVLQVRLKNSSTSANTGWLVASVQTVRTGYANVYYVTVPQGDYDIVNLSRKDPNSTTIWNETKDMDIDATKNYITVFYDKGIALTWDTFDELATGWTFNYDAGNDNWRTVNITRRSKGDTYGYATVTFPNTPGTSYKFNLNSENTAYGNGGTMSSSNSIGWTFGTSPADCWITTSTTAGEYLMKFEMSTKTLSVYFPEAVTPRTSLTSGRYGTICLNRKATGLNGASFYSVYGKDADTPTELYLEAVAGDLEAGVPYIFQASGTSITATLIGEPVAVAGSHKGLYGTLEDITVNEDDEDGVEDDIYIISGNKVRRAINCTVGAGRAYIDMSEVDVTSDPTQAPGRRIVTMDFESENTTNIENVEVSDMAVKFFENGQMFIIRNGVKYDATGRIVK